MKIPTYQKTPARKGREREGGREGEKEKQLRGEEGGGGETDHHVTPRDFNGSQSVIKRGKKKRQEKLEEKEESLNSRLESL